MPLYYHPIVEHLQSRHLWHRGMRKWSYFYADGQKMDAGPIIGQVDVPLDTNENGISLRSKQAQLVPLLRTHLPQLIQGTAKETSQEEKNVTYCRKLTKRIHAWIFPQDPAGFSFVPFYLFGSIFSHEGII